MRNALLALATLAAGLLPAQDARELSTPTGWLTYVGVTATTINNAISGGYRVTDIEYRGTLFGSPLFDAVLVQNTGPYATGWWWYYGITSTQLSSFLSTNQARLIDLEAYDDGAGNTRFACVMVDNTGANNKAWWYYFNTSSTTIGNAVSANNARIVDLDEYTIGGTTYYSAVMIRNTGADARGWWYYYNITPAQVSSFINSNQARIYDLDPRSNGNFNVVMIRDLSPVAWYWWYGMQSSDILYLANNYGVRVIDIQTYSSGGQTRYAMATINNSNALTTDVGNRMRSTTDGQVGCWLQQLNGGNFANLNGDTQFEPASTMKTLHHVHAMRRVRLNAVTLATMINVFTATSGSCPQDTNPVNESLQTVLRLMMENSDNNRTQAVTAFFGQANINATAAALGMASTSLNHRLGCGAPAIANPNQITLRDLNTLHEQVANGYLGTFRDTFYTLMLDNLNDLTIGSIIDQEGASLGLSSNTVSTFRSLSRLAHKGGSYGLSGGGPLYFHRAEFGFLRLPWVVSGNLTEREYGFGAFVNNASVDANASAAIYTQALPTLLRPTIRAALQSWTNVLASAVTIGTGCGGYSQTITGLPYINSTPTYRGNSGFANTLAVMGIGFSSTSWNNVPLPASMVGFGSAAGCNAYNDVLATRVTVANASGTAAIPFAIPNNPDLLNVLYYTQFYSFGPTNFRTSNGMRSIIGL